jgi:SAM-dependent methyltransferase
MRKLQQRLAMKMMAKTTQKPSCGAEDSGTELRLPCRRVVSVLDLTEDVLRRSGIVRGMHVLDLGCGTGDASLWIAKLVGPSGLVVGVDRSAEAIDLAQKRATMAGRCYWTRFVVANPETFSSLEPFDAVVVRLAPLHQRRPAAISLRIAAHVRPGGLVLFVPGTLAARRLSSI